MKYVLDTTAFSAFMRRDEALLELLAGFAPRDIVTVPPVIAEIQYGIQRLDRTSKKYLLLQTERDRILSVVAVLPWVPGSSEKYGEIKAALERRGQLIDDFDIAIAAIALSHRCGVLTANLKHFQRIERLESRSWS